MTDIITETHARRVLELVSQGLVKGLGKPKPGQGCIEDMVCLALGLPHSNKPTCVAPSLRELKIRLNDANWSSPMARANGLRRLAVAQLGSAGVLDEKEFARRVAELAIRKSVPEALRAAAKIQKTEKHRAALLDAAARCEKEGTREAALEAKNAAHAADNASAAYAAADNASAAYAAADVRDKSLADFAECVVQILVAMVAPGCKWLPLTEEPIQ